MEDSKQKTTPADVERDVRQPDDHPDERDALEWCPFSASLGSIQSATCGSMHSVVLNSETLDSGHPGNVLYSTGSNNAGQLGLGHKYDMTEPTKVDAFANLRLTVHEIQAGPKHNAAVVPYKMDPSLSEVWTWGQGWYGRLGHGVEETLIHPRAIQEFRGE